MSYGLAIIGYGGMGSWHHSSIRQNVSDITVVGAYDIRPEIQGRIKENGLKVYPDFSSLLADDSVDIVTIAVPNNFHKDYAIACLRAGKNVVCEKPVAMNAGELEEIMAVAKETGQLFTVHQNRRWDRDYQIVKTILAENMIGTPYFIESRVQGSRGSLYGWRGYKVNGGGMLLDWGVHLLDQVLDLVPAKVVSISSHLESVFSNEVDDSLKVFLQFDNHVSAVVEVSTNCFINLPRWHLSCTDGTAVVEDWECNGKMVKLKENAEEMKWDDDIVYMAAGPTRTMAPRPAHTMQELALPDKHPDWSEFYQNIVAVLDHKADLIVRPEQCLRVMKVIDAVFASQKEAGIVRCSI